MKNMVVIIHEKLQQDLADQLREKVSGFTFSRVEGHGEQRVTDEMLSARDRVVGYIPRVRVDILLEDTEVAGVIELIRQVPGIAGHSVYWVNDVHESGRI
jgi:nitrogen regulatory protein P-II 1